jgi:hypothetical protein
MHLTKLINLNGLFLYINCLFSILISLLLLLTYLISYTFYLTHLLKIILSLNPPKSFLKPMLSSMHYSIYPNSTLYILLIIFSHSHLKLLKPYAISRILNEISLNFNLLLNLLILLKILFLKLHKPITQHQIILLKDLTFLFSKIIL